MEIEYCDCFNIANRSCVCRGQGRHHAFSRCDKCRYHFCNACFETHNCIPDNVDEIKHFYCGLSPHVSTLPQMPCEEQRFSLGYGIWNVHKLSKTNDQLDDKIGCIVDVFLKNPWIDVVILNEVNKTGMPLLEKELNKRGLKLLTWGPFLLSKSEASQWEIENHNREEGQMLERQTEYYPVIVRQDSDITLENVYIYHQNGDVSKWDHESDKPDPYVWREQSNKQQFRPVLVYEIKKNNCTQSIHLGAVHTSPSGGEWDRTGIYQKQLDKPLAKLAGVSNPIVGGDYYQTDETLVKKLGHQGNKIREEDWFPGVANELHERGYPAQPNNLARNTQGLTFSADLKKKGLKKVGPLSGTNGWLKKEKWEKWEADEEAKRKRQFDALLEESNLRYADDEGNLKEEEDEPKTTKKKKNVKRKQDDERYTCETKMKPPRGSPVQHADLFVCNSEMHAVSGIVNLGSDGGLVLNDENHQALAEWDKTSDHAFVAGLFSNGFDANIAARLYNILGWDSDKWRRAMEQAKQLNAPYELIDAAAKAAAQKDLDELTDEDAVVLLYTLKPPRPYHLTDFDPRAMEAPRKKDDDDDEEQPLKRQKTMHDSGTSNQTNNNDF